MRDRVCAAAILASTLAPLSIAGADSLGAYGRTIDLPVTPMDVRIQYGTVRPGSTDLVGEGTIGANLPGDGRLTLRVPQTIGQRTLLGESHLAADYDLVREGELAPKLDLVAELALPTARGARGALPGVKARASKQLQLGVIREVHVEEELLTEGPGLARSYRTAVGTSFRIHHTTTAALDFVSIFRPNKSASVRDETAQLGVCHALGPHSNVRLGLGAGISNGQSSLRSTLGVDLRF